MSDALIYYSTYSDENYGLQVQRNKIEVQIPAGVEIQQMVLTDVPYIQDVQLCVMAETYDYVMIDGVEHRVDPTDRTKAYRYEFPRCELTGFPVRSKKCWYNEEKQEWVRYVHQGTRRSKEEFEKVKDTLVLPVSWTPEQFNTLPDDYKATIEYGPNDVTWCEVNDSRDQSSIGDNPVV